MSSRAEKLRAELARVELDELMATIEDTFVVPSWRELKQLVAEIRAQRARVAELEREVLQLRGGHVA